LEPLIKEYGEATPLKTLLETFSFDELLEQGILKACEDPTSIPPNRVAISLVENTLEVSSFEAMQKMGNDKIYLLDLSKLVSMVERRS
jgi:DNA polymerase III sliding clamp (beta) subunit (PCNA family)